MDQLILFWGGWTCLTLVGLVGGIKRGHKPDTMGIFAFLFGPLCLFAILIDRRGRCAQCHNTTIPEQDYCPTCGLQLTQDPIFWRAQRQRQERLAQMPQR